MGKKSLYIWILVFCTGFSTLFFSCAKHSSTAIIWTDRAEVVSYAEYFNKTHTQAKVVVLYKPSLLRSLPPARDEVAPDVLIGSWLKNSRTRKFFAPLDYLFTDNTSLSRASFYTELIDYGVISEKQYLLPVSFNIPAVIFRTQDEALMSNAHTTTLEEIRKLALDFNKKDASGSFTNMGFAPSANSSFLYLTSRMRGADYIQRGNVFRWNNEALQASVDYLRSWTEENGGSATEQNFQFKYLYMPTYRQVSSGRSLFAYCTSDEFFTFSEEESAGLALRWITKDETITVEDSVVTMGLYRKSKNIKTAEAFITWLLQEETQKSLIERTKEMNLDTITFGIAGGFSSLKNVNTRIYPIYYRTLLGNQIPKAKLSLPGMLPYRWLSLRERVIVPFLEESISLEEAGESLEERIEEWSRTSY